MTRMPAPCSAQTADKMMFNKLGIPYHLVVGVVAHVDLPQTMPDALPIFVLWVLDPSTFRNPNSETLSAQGDKTLNRPVANSASTWAFGISLLPFDGLRLVEEDAAEAFSANVIPDKLC